MEIIESHKWVHIPHMDRQPTKLPKKYKTKKLDLDYGDVIIFSTLLIGHFPQLNQDCHYRY